MKKKFALALAAIMTLGAVPVYAGVPAAPTASKVLVNGESKAFEAYNINSNNYFKLRDIAYVLNGTEAAFSVGWDGAANSIALDTNGTYAPTGSEMKVSGTKDIKDAVESKSTILIDGEKAALKAYTIKGNNYFKLRDLGTSLGFDVGWDNASQTISITSPDFLGGYGGPGEDYVPEEGETPVVPAKPAEPAKPATLTEKQMSDMGFYSQRRLAGLLKTNMAMVYGVPKTSKIADVQIDNCTLNGKSIDAVVVKLPNGDASYYYDDTLNEFCMKYYYAYDDLKQSEYDQTTWEPIPDNLLETTYTITTTDGTVYTYTEKTLFACEGYFGDPSWGSDLLPAKYKALEEQRGIF